MIQSLFIVGLALTTIGIGCIYRPAALIFAGILFAVIAFFLQWVKLQTKPGTSPETK